MTSYAPPTDPYFDIVYEDDFILLANKASGLLTVPGRGEDKKDCLISRLQTQYPHALIVHRLDMATSGLVLLALNKEIHRNLSIAFQDRKIRKRYIAWIAGQPEHASGYVDLPLMSDWANRPLQRVDLELGKPSLTHWSVLKKETGKTRVALVPETGRSHQLRLHMASIGHPILGDALYAPEPVQAMSSRLLLHAQQLTFIHPVSGEKMCVTSPPDF